MSTVEAYKVGLCMASVCAPKSMDVAEVERQLNVQHPTGISSSWQVSADNFRGGEDNPCPCDEDATRQHWLLEC